MIGVAGTDGEVAGAVVVTGNSGLAALAATFFALTTGVLAIFLCLGFFAEAVFALGNFGLASLLPGLLAAVVAGFATAFFALVAGFETIFPFAGFLVDAVFRS